MVAAISTMRELGSSAPDFILSDVRTNASVQLDDFESQPLLVMFICNHCPYVIHIIQPLVALANEYRSKGFGVVAISSNDVANYPQDDPVRMREFSDKYRFDFSYCYDESQHVALSYGAACTPDFFVFDEQHLLRYRGQMDGSRPGNAIPVSGEDLRASLEAILNGNSTVDQQTPSMGCSIKWKAGNEPSY